MATRLKAVLLLIYAAACCAAQPGGGVSGIVAAQAAQDEQGARAVSSLADVQAQLVLADEPQPPPAPASSLPRDAQRLRELLRGGGADEREALRTLGELYQARLGDTGAAVAVCACACRAGGGGTRVARCAPPAAEPSLTPWATQSGQGGVTRDYALAADHFQRAAEMGDPAAQEEMAFLLASGLGRPVDEAAAVVYWYFAASGNRTASQLALGWRHAQGHSVPRSCAAAALYYVPAAAAALRPPLGSQQAPGSPAPLERVRLTHDYPATAAARTKERDMVAYYRYSADQGNVDAAAAMGQLLVGGGRGVRRDYPAAAGYLATAAARGDADASAALGMLYANGQGVVQDPVRALRLLRTAAERGHAAGQLGLGLATLAGFGVAPDTGAALTWLTAAAEQGSAEAHAALGSVYAQGLRGAPADRVKALLHLTTAAQAGQLTAALNLALLHLGQLAQPPAHRSPLGAPPVPPPAPQPAQGACRAALALLKSVAERGEAARVLEAAHEAYQAGDQDAALRLHLRGAHMGIELAQANAAFLLAQRQQGAAALKWLRRSADQGHAPSLVLLGDAHFYGRGTAPDASKAAASYSEAGAMHSAQALFNLGAMHQLGRGVRKDAHLAKRFYDMASAAAAEAQLPCTLALWGLRVQRGWEEGVQPWAGRLQKVDPESALLALLCAALATVLGALRVRRGRPAEAEDEDAGPALVH